MADTDGAWYPDQHCMEAYLQLEAAGAPARHRLLMNMLLLYPSETKVDTARNQDMLDFYMEKTGSVSAEHLQHKLQLYNDATDEKRRDDEYMCDLTKEFQSGAEPTAVVNEGRAGSTEYFERWVDDDEDEHRRDSNALWEENSRSAAEEQRLAAERNASAATRTNQDDGETTGAPDGADTAASKPPVEPTQPPSAPPFAATSIIAIPEVVPDAVQETKHGETTGAELDGADTAASMPPVAPPQPPSEPPVAAAPVAAAPKTNEEDLEKPPPKPEVVPDAVQESKHGETTGAQLDGADTAASKPPVAPPQPLQPPQPPSVAADPHGEAVDAYNRTLVAASKIARRGTEGATCLNDTMALLASYCAMPTLGVSPSNPNDGGCVGWLIAHHLRCNLGDEQSKWQCAVAELALPKYFEQEVFSGVARLRGDSPMLLVSTAVCMLKETPSSRSQTNQELPGDLTNLHFVLSTRMGHAMRASVGQGVFDSVTLRNAGLHPYLVVAFLQICTHQETFNADQQWLLSNYPSLVTLLHKPVAIVMANEEPRRFLLVHVDDLRRAPTKPRPLIFKDGAAAILNMILDLIEEVKDKGDANDKLLFRATGESRPDGGELDPTAKLDVLGAMKWALKEFHDATYPDGSRMDPDSRRPDAVASEPARRLEVASIPPSKRPRLTAAAKRTDSPQLSSAASSTSTALTTARGSAVAQLGDRKRSSTLADLLQHEDETNSLHSIITTMSDQDIALIGGSPSAAGDERELASFVMRATRDADEKTPADAFDLLTKRTSHLLVHTIVDRLEKMYREFTDAPVPLQQQDLTFMTGRVNQYELSANEAVQSMHEAAKGYNPAYRPHTDNAEKKIKAACDRVRDAVAVAQQKLGKKRTKSSAAPEPTPSHASHVGMSALSPLNSQISFQGVSGDAAAQAIQKAQRDALAAQQEKVDVQNKAAADLRRSEELLRDAARQRERDALAAQQEKLDAQNKAAADLRRSEERLRDVERERAEAMEKAAVERLNAEAQAVTALNKAALDLQQQVAASQMLEEAKDKAERAAQELRDKNDKAEKEMARLKAELDMQKLRLQMEANAAEREAQLRASYDALLQTQRLENFKLSVDNAKSQTAMETKDSATVKLEKFQEQLMEARVQGGLMRGAFSGFLAGGGAGPSESNIGAGMAEIQSLLVLGGSGSGNGSSAQPHPRELMPPPPPRPPPAPAGPHMLLKDAGNKTSAEANVPAAVQSLIKELTEAETNASQATPEPRHTEAGTWYAWKKALLKTSQDIAMHQASEDQYQAARQYRDAENSASEKAAMEAILEEQVTNVRALLDERRSQS